MHCYLYICKRAYIEIPLWNGVIRKSIDKMFSVPKKNQQKKTIFN